MNESLAERLRKQAANKLYKNVNQNLTQKELILKCYSRSVHFIELAIDNHKENNLSEFRENLNKAMFLIQTMHSNLNYTDSQGNTLDVAFNLHKAYSYILKTLGNGLRGNNIKDFDICINFINELYFAFQSIK